ncbi:hypothetical protein AALA24_08060 [Anaerovoracaceae bacterium 42-11]|nr:hypothetical protein [Emergencia sp.]
MWEAAIALLLFQLSSVFVLSFLIFSVLNGTQMIASGLMLTIRAKLLQFIDIYDMLDIEIKQFKKDITTWYYLVNKV